MKCYKQLLDEGVTQTTHTSDPGCNSLSNKHDRKDTPFTL